MAPGCIQTDMVRALEDASRSTPHSVDVVRYVVRGARAAEFWRAGRHAAAERLLREVAAALVRRNAPAPAAEALISLGRFALERGRASDATALFAEAAGLAAMCGDGPLSVEAKVWEAAAATDAAHLTTAERLCREALSVGELGPELRARAEATLARVLLWQGRVEEAAARDLRLQGAPSETRAFVMATDVRVRLEAADVFEAGRRARELWDLAQDAPSPLVVVLGLAAQVRVALASGDLTVGAERLDGMRRAVRAARAPLRLVRVRLLWVDALRQAGRTQEASREAAALNRLRTVVPPLLRQAVDRRVQGESGTRSRGRATSVVCHRDVATLLQLAVTEPDDRVAVAQAIERTAATLGTHRVELWTAPGDVLLRVGSGAPTRTGVRVLDEGAVVVENAEGPAIQLGIPVRLGAGLVGAVVASWRRQDVVPAARELLELLAIALAPRIDALRSAADHQASAGTSMPELLGGSAAIAAVRQSVARAARAPFAALIEGESGSGKELVARALHRLGDRRSGRFCDLNCAALPDELIESELFGHARGAFTGAAVDRPGIVEEASGGTLFLDEVADLSARAQAKLLRVIQQQEVRRVGESLSRKVDLRVVSAANRDLRAQVAAGQFRQDLLYRLDVIRIHVPPLRDRREDIPSLARHFWRAAASSVGTDAHLGSSVIGALVAYDWPGNVRELQNVMAAMAVRAAPRGVVQAGLLPPAISAFTVTPPVRFAEARREFERRFVQATLARAGGRRSRAARDLGLSRQGLLKMMSRIGL